MGTDLRFVLAELRACSILTASAVVVGLLVILVPLSSTLVPIPGASQPIPGERLFPAAVAAAAALILPNRWEQFERMGVRSIPGLRSSRYAVAVSLVVLGCLGASLCGVDAPLLSLSLAAFAIITVVMVAMPSWWSATVPALLYVQVFAPDLEVMVHQRLLSVILVVIAAGCYLWPHPRSTQGTA